VVSRIVSVRRLPCCHSDTTDDTYMRMSTEIKPAMLCERFTFHADGAPLRGGEPPDASQHCAKHLLKNRAASRRSHLRNDYETKAAFICFKSLFLGSYPKSVRGVEKL